MPDILEAAPAVYLSDLLDPWQLEQEITDGYVTRKPHPELPISILTYTDRAQYDRHWTEVTSKCRGLVVDDATGQVLAHPFPKFHLASLHGDPAHPYAPALPDEPFEIYSKIDGSLGIVFHHAGAWRVASKGSFISEQATWAQNWLDGCDTSALQPGLTYLVEIVYPENRIVVDYSGLHTLVLLAVTDPTGAEQQLDEHNEIWHVLGGMVTPRWHALPLEQLQRYADENRNPLDDGALTGTQCEGWVIRFRSGLRAKIKYADYLRLHRRLTGVTARHIWEAIAVREIGNAAPAHATAFSLRVPTEEVRALLEQDDPLAEVLEQVPDEFADWVRGIENDLLAAADAEYGRIGAAYLRLVHLGGDRKAFTAAAKTTPYPRELFLILDGKSVGPLVWGRLRPPATKPFRSDEV